MNARNLIKNEMERVLVSNTLHSKWTFIELYNIQPLGEFEVALVLKIYSKCSIPENKSPVLDILRRAKDLARCRPINANGERVLECQNICLNRLLQLQIGIE